MLSAMLPSGGTNVHVCKRCGAGMILENAVPKCLSCDVPPPPPNAPINDFPDPGVEKLERLMRAQGVVIPPHEKQTVPAPQIVPITTKVQIVDAGVKFSQFEDCVRQAIQTLKACPMPKDLRQFKIIQKATASLETILISKEDK